MTLEQNIAEAKATLRKLKKAAPWLLVQYLELQSAHEDLRRAEERYRKARVGWKSLGK